MIELTNIFLYVCLRDFKSIVEQANILPKLWKTAACKAFCELGPMDKASPHTVIIALTAGTDLLITAKYSGDTPALFTSDAEARAATRASTVAPWPCLAARCRAVSRASFLQFMMLSPLSLERFNSTFTALRRPALAAQCRGVSSAEFRWERKFLSLLNLW